MRSTSLGDKRGEEQEGQVGGGLASRSRGLSKKPRMVEKWGERKKGLCLGNDGTGG